MMATRKVPRRIITKRQLLKHRPRPQQRRRRRYRYRRRWSEMEDVPKEEWDHSPNVGVGGGETATTRNIPVRRRRRSFVGVCVWVTAWGVRFNRERSRASLWFPLHSPQQKPDDEVLLLTRYWRTQLLV